MKNSEEIMAKINELDKQLIEATRTEAKVIKQQIHALTKEKNAVLG